MTESDFYDLLERYQKGLITPGELAQVEAFLHKNEEKPSVLKNWSESDRIKAKDQMWFSIQQVTFDKKPNHLKVWKIAASFLLLMAAAMFAYLFYVANEPSNIIVKNTALGQRSKIILSDGSIVHLNAGSSLSYMEKFEEETREVDLTGEAFFEVKKNPNKPFIIHSIGVDTKVLGTSFNVKAYPDEDVAVTVVSGKVSVEKDDLQEFLIPGEQAVFDEYTLNVSEVDANTYSSWKDGVLIFEKSNISEIARRMSRYYGVEIKVELDSDECELYLHFDHFSIREALIQLSLVSGVEYRVIDKQTVLLKGNGCK